VQLRHTDTHKSVAFFLKPTVSETHSFFLKVFEDTQEMARLLSLRSAPKAEVKTAPWIYNEKRGYANISQEDGSGFVNFDVIDLDTKKMKTARYTYKVKPDELSPSVFHQVEITEGFDWIRVRLTDDFLRKPGNLFDIPIYVDPETDDQTLAEDTEPPVGHRLASLRVKVMPQLVFGKARVEVFLSEASTVIRDAYVNVAAKKATTAQTLKDKHTAIVHGFIPEGEPVVVLDTPAFYAAQEYLRLGRKPELLTVVGRDAGMKQPDNLPPFQGVFRGEFSRFLAAAFYRERRVYSHVDFDMCGNPDSAVKMLRSMQTYDAFFDGQVVRITYCLRGFKGGKDKESILSLFRSVVTPTFDLEALHFEYYKNNNKTKMGFVVVKLKESSL
jgi:hypothetical protein